MERDEADLQPEGQEQKGQRIGAPRRLRQSSHRIADQRTAGRNALREEHQGHQEKSLAENGKTDIQTRRTLCLGCFVKSDEAIGGKACHRKKQIEAGKVSDEECAEVADERHQPPDDKATPVRLVTQINSGVSRSEEHTSEL